MNLHCSAGIIAELDHDHTRDVLFTFEVFFFVCLAGIEEALGVKETHGNHTTAAIWSLISLGHNQVHRTIANHSLLPLKLVLIPPYAGFKVS